VAVTVKPFSCGS